MSLDILLDLRTLTSQLPHGNHYSKILIQVIMENIYTLTLFVYGAGICASVNIHNSILATNYISS